jgi:hypothetical protein
VTDLAEILEREVLSERHQATRRLSAHRSSVRAGRPCGRVLRPWHRGCNRRADGTVDTTEPERWPTLEVPGVLAPSPLTPTTFLDLRDALA